MPRITGREAHWLEAAMQSLNRQLSYSDFTKKSFYRNYRFVRLGVYYNGKMNRIARLCLFNRQGSEGR